MANFKKDLPEEKTNSFSKSIMSIIVFLYLIGSLIGTALVILAAIMNVQQNTPLDTGMFIAYAAYLGGPTATAIIFYAWKSKAENVIKISKTFEAGEQVNVMDALSKLGGN